MSINHVMKKEQAIKFFKEAIKEHDGDVVYLSNILSGVMKAPNKKKKGKCFEVSLGVHSELFKEKYRDNLNALMNCKLILLVLPKKEFIHVPKEGENGKS